MPITVSSFLTPRNGNTYPLLEDVHLKGGLQTYASQAELDAIDPEKLKHGMIAVVNKVLYQYDTNTASWGVLQMGGAYFPIESVTVGEGTYTPSLTENGKELWITAFTLTPLNFLPENFVGDADIVIRQVSEGSISIESSDPGLALLCPGGIPITRTMGSSVLLRYKADLNLLIVEGDVQGAA